MDMNAPHVGIPPHNPNSFLRIALPPSWPITAKRECDDHVDDDDEGYGSWSDRNHHHPWYHTPSHADRKPKSQSIIIAHVIPELLCMIMKRADREDPLSHQSTLYNAALVNRHWNAVIAPLLYSKPVITSFHAFRLFTGTLALPSLIHGEDIRVLDLTQLRLQTPTHTSLLTLISEKCHSIHTLKLWIESFDILTIQHLVSTAPITSLTLLGHIGRWAPETALGALRKRIAQLKYLHIDVGFDGDAFRFRLASLVSKSVSPALAYLRCSGIEQTDIPTLIDRAPNLSRGIFTWSSFTPQTLSNMSKWRLQTLDLRGCLAAVTPPVLTTLLTTCPLSSLDISFTSTSLDESTLFASLIAQHGKRLNHLFIAGWTNLPATALHNMIPALRNIHTLSLAWIPAVSASTLELLAHHCPRLQRLDIRGARLSEDALRTFLLRTPAMEVLKVANGSEILTDDTMAEMDLTIDGEEGDEAVPTGSSENATHIGSGMPSVAFLEWLKKEYRSAEMIGIEDEDEA
ncbi:hypothetical protein HDU85_006504 [Gaertneriomyces sp. JEL0708]|nr:hypothetical protein HDU85_006504 [Gaertneriomyces sp. JEL0708]